MAGKKQKRDGGSPMSLVDALAATRSARARVLALAARLEETERTILAAMASPRAAKPAAKTAAAPTAPVKRPVGRPRTRPLPEAKAPARKPAARTTTGRRPVGRPPKS